MAGYESGKFSGAGGVEIFWQTWLPEQSSRATVVVAHGISEHSGRYAHVAERLSADGYTVRALDHRGHGQSGGPRVLIDSLENALADLDRIVDDAGGRPFLLGHSMGGCISLAYALEHQEKLAGLILSGPLAVLPPTPRVQEIMIRLISRVAPKLGMIPVDPTAVSRDSEVVAAYIADPLNYHGKLPARTLVELANAIERFPAELKTLTLPLLLLHGGADPLVNPDASRFVEANVGSTDTTLQIYEGLQHEIFNELPPDRERVIDDLLAWLATHTS